MSALTKHFKGNQGFILEQLQGGHHCPCHHHVCATGIKSRLFSDWLGLAANEVKVMSVCAHKACEYHSVCWHFAHHKGARCENWTTPTQGRLYCREIKHIPSLRSPLKIMDTLQQNPCHLNILLKTFTPGKGSLLKFTFPCGTYNQEIWKGDTDWLLMQPTDTQKFLRAMLLVQQKDVIALKACTLI